MTDEQIKSRQINIEKEVKKRFPLLKIINEWDTQIWEAVITKRFSEQEATWAFQELIRLEELEFDKEG
jgi:hypothetical protein